MEAELAQGTERVINGQRRVFYDGYWIRALRRAERSLARQEAADRGHDARGCSSTPSRASTSRARALTTPARLTKPKPTSPKKRVKGAMLAGALFNRAADIFTKLVELEAQGIRIQSDNPLMRKCGQHLQEALGAGQDRRCTAAAKKASTSCGASRSRPSPTRSRKFYESRYIKIALTMRGIDEIAEALYETIGRAAAVPGIEPVIWSFAKAAKINCETLRDDADIFEVWAGLRGGWRKAVRLRPRTRPKRRRARSARARPAPADQRARAGARHHTRPRAHAQERAHLHRPLQRLP